MVNLIFVIFFLGFILIRFFYFTHNFRNNEENGNNKSSKNEYHSFVVFLEVKLDIPRASTNNCLYLEPKELKPK